MKRWFSIVSTLLIFTILTHLVWAAHGNGYKPDEAYAEIEEKSLKAHLNFLASDLLEGREATSRGYDIAAAYAASLFQQYGLIPVTGVKASSSFLQSFSLLEVVRKNDEVLQVVTSSVGEDKVESFSHRTHFFAGMSNRSISLNAKIVFAGYGLIEKEANYDDFVGIDVKDKIVVVMTHAPGEGDEHSYFYRKENRNRFFNGGEILRKRQNAQQRGALAVLVITDPKGKHPTIFNNDNNGNVNTEKKRFNVTTPRRRMVLPEDMNVNQAIPLITISDAVAASIFEQPEHNLAALQRQIDMNQQAHSFELSDKRVKINVGIETRLLNTTNVIAKLEGSDPQLKDEFVIVGAHLDHEGTRDGYIWNGADDDASGSAAVLELAAAFARARIRPRRSVLFCLWGAEEKGLLGSRYFTDNPLVPLEKISIAIQLDMIGRDVEPQPHQLVGKSRPVDLKRYIFAETPAQTPEVEKMLLQANETVGLEVNITSQLRVNADSDHYPFWLKKIPILSLDDGVFHEDYHQPSDIAEKINFSKILAVSRLTYLMAREVANHPNKLKWDESKENATTNTIN